MSTTKNGIYYPNDYESVADIPADMKKLAESVDTKISENKTEIEKIKKEQTTQSTNISNLQKDNTTNKQDITEIKAKDTEQDKYIAELEAENARLREDLNGLPKGQASGESIDLSDSAEMRCDLKISGNSKQETREGYNKLNINIATNTTSGVTMTNNENGTYTFSGTSNASYFKALATNITITEGCIGSGIGSLKNAKLIAQVRRSGTSSDNYLNLQGAVFNKEDIIKQIYVQANSGTTVSGTIYPMINNGTEIKPFEQYGASPSPDYPSEVESCGDNGSINEVICNKNICNFGSIQNSNIGLTNNLDKNVWKISGTSNANGYTTAFGRISLGKLKAGTYSFSWKYSGTLTYVSGGDTGISLLNKSSSEMIMNRALNTENKYSKFILTEDTEISLGLWNTGRGNVYSLEIECQLELSETNTEIVEHQSQTYTIPTQQPMRSIGDIRDTFIKKNNKWYERHNVFRQILNGEENWSYDSSRKIFSYNNNSVLAQTFYNTTVVPPVYSSHYTMAAWNDYANENNNASVLCYGWTYTAYRIRDDRFTTYENFKAWLSEQYNAGEPVYFDYILETPLDIECTEEQSTILFDIEENAKTYDKVTHMYSTDNVSPVIDVTYKKDIETMITNIEQAILSQGGNI